MKIIKPLLITAILMTLLSCAQFRRLEPQYALPTQSISIDVEEGKTLIVFYNGSNFFTHGMDMTDKIDIVISDKNVGSIRMGEYLVIDMLPGEYKMNLTHYDVGKFSDDHTLEVIGSEMYIEVYNGLFSTNYKVVDKLPDEFEKRYRTYYK